MIDLFEKGVKEQILSRISQLRPDTEPKWGKMNVAQMLTHCCRPLALALGEAHAKPGGWLMRLFGKLAKRTVLSEKPFKQNLPTDPTFITLPNQYEFETARAELVAIVERFVEKQDTVVEFKHPFFGKMSKHEWGISQYKHLDHHLGQFGV